MRNLQLTSPEAGHRIAAIIRSVSIVVASLLVVGLVGYQLSPPIQDPETEMLRWFDALIAIGLGVFVWSVFHLFEEPRKYWRWRKWTQNFGMLLLWLIFAVVVGFCLHMLAGDEPEIFKPVVVF